tara:strand:+ start:423 stop:887 length:465 start_codon:yes stop_codon:yes gene_type:complete
MKRLPKKLQQIIKKKRFNFNSLDGRDSGVEIKLRIQTVGTTEERWNEDETPINRRGWSEVYVNVVVSGTASTKARWKDEVQLKPIEEVSKVSRNDCYRYDNSWGYEHHKRIRDHIRSISNKEIANYLKLFGICEGLPRYGGRRVLVKKISWGNV